MLPPPSRSIREVELNTDCPAFKASRLKLNICPNCIRYQRKRQEKRTPASHSQSSIQRHHQSIQKKRARIRWTYGYGSSSGHSCNYSRNFCITYIGSIKEVLSDLPPFPREQALQGKEHWH